MICERAEIEETAIWCLPSINRSGLIIYWLVMGLFLTGFTSLFLIRVDISVRANGIIRPLNERTEMKSPLSGIIDTIYYKEGEWVKKGSILMVIRDPVLKEKQQMNETEILQCQDFIHDLSLLTGTDTVSFTKVSSLKTPLYKQEALKFFSDSDKQRVMLEKADHETRLNEKLAKAKVISPKEMYDIRMQREEIISVCESFRREQFTIWQADRLKYNTELKQNISRRSELNQQYENDRIRAPVSGNFQELNTLYAGNSIHFGESICTISPDGNLIGECYVSSGDIGLLKVGQQVRFQIESLDYNYFGGATGNISSIGNDYILLDHVPVFRVRCRLNEKMLTLSNGFPGILKKGMSFRAGFITCNRSLWQLMYDGLNDWLNPVHQSNL
jgi:membrane fusion protein, peptide pheromone/bacteriocin exporter